MPGIDTIFHTIPLPSFDQLSLKAPALHAPGLEPALALRDEHFHLPPTTPVPIP
ncbi:MAG TPA: hypothetical protein VFU86_15775 [Terriglobales bacterium]|nr:hypothetical protein [Terriglobales bacterium]